MSVEIRSRKPGTGVFAAGLVAVGLVAWWGLPGCSGDPAPAPTTAAPTPGNPPSTMPKKRMPLPALRFSERGRVDLIDSVGLIDLNGDFTIELWHRVEGAGSLAGDDPLPPVDAVDDVSHSAPRPVIPGLRQGRPADAVADVSHSAPGWFLRKVHLDPAEPDTFMRYEFLMGRPAPEKRFSVVSIAVAQGGPWHHVAVSKSLNEVRLFVDGALVAAQFCGGKQFANSSAPIALGVPLLSPEDRKLWGDIRAFRLSKTGRYQEKFVPQETFDNDPETLALLDFSRQAGNELADLGKNAHPGVFTPGFERSFYIPNGPVFNVPVGIRWIHDEEHPDKDPYRSFKHPPRTAVAPMSARLSSISDDPTRYNEVRIQGRIGDKTGFLINREFTECFMEGPPPEQLTFNGVAWSPKRFGDTLHSEHNTVYLPGVMDFEDVSVVKLQGRGQIEPGFHSQIERSCRIRISDSEPGSDEYDIIVRFGVALPELPVAGDNGGLAASPPRGGRQPASASPQTAPLPGGNGTPPPRYAPLYEKYGRHDPAWDEALRKFFGAAEASRVLLYDPRAASDRQIVRRHSAEQSELPLLIRSGAAALRAGCDDPLFLVVFSRHLLASHNPEDAAALVAQAEAGFAKSRYPAWHKVLVSIERLAHSSDAAAAAAVEERCAADFVALAAGPFTADEPQQLLAEMTGLLQRIEFSHSRGPVVWALANNEQIDPWLRHMVLARYHLEVGWYAGARGGHRHPTKQESRAWRSRMQQAHAQLLAASKVNSKRLDLTAELGFVSECLRTTLEYQLNPPQQNIDPFAPH